MPILQNAMNEEVLAVIHTLDEPSRESLLLRFVEGFSPAEIAELRGETPNAISVRINRALKKVREHLHVHE